MILAVIKKEKKKNLMTDEAAHEHAKWLKKRGNGDGNEPKKKQKNIIVMPIVYTLKTPDTVPDSNNIRGNLSPNYAPASPSYTPSS